MSELNEKFPSSNSRRFLLATVSMAALAVVATSPASAADSNTPSVWIELGGQLERVSDGQEIFSPSFLSTSPRPDFETILPQSAQRSPRYAYGAEFNISIKPQGSDWVISAGLRYGRSNGTKNFIEQTAITKTPYPPAPQFLITRAAHRFARTVSEHNFTNAIADFQAGRDVGLGLLGNPSNTVISLGVRYAQLNSRSSFNVHERPDYGWQKIHPFYTRFYHNYGADEHTTRSFHGIGPSLSVKSSSSLTHPSEDSEIALDWGVNAALLFGRQKASARHSTSGGVFHSWTGYSQLYHHSYAHARTRSVTVPNVGGFAGVSYRYAEAKISLGYRADFFFGAVDGGIDTRKTYDRNFYGPFATISFGLGG